MVEELRIVFFSLYDDNNNLKPLTKAEEKRLINYLDSLIKGEQNKLNKEKERIDIRKTVKAQERPE